MSAPRPRSTADRRAARLFCGVELAQRIERVEMGMLADCFEAVCERDPGAGAQAIEIAGGLAVWTGADQPFNKVAGLGFGGPVEPEALEAVERMYGERGEAVRVELPSLAEPGIAEALTRRGYSLVGFENVLGLALPCADLPPVPAGIEVVEGSPGDISPWMELMIEGFAHPDEQGVASDEEFPRAALERAFTDLSSASGFQRYLAKRDGSLAGAASQRISGGVVQLCGAATLQAHRRRGVQGSLLATRLETAATRGCDLAVVTTQPGSKSQQNVQRLGFDLLYTRAVLVRDP